jgi:hypothetical protein
MSTDTATRPAWVAEGVKVICWTEGGSHTVPHYALGTITKLNAKTFRVTSSRAMNEPLFRYDSHRADTDTCRINQGDARLASIRMVAPRDSNVGRKIEADARDETAQRRAARAVHGWEREPRNRAAVDAVIREMTKLRDQLDSGPADTDTDTATAKG